MMKKESIARYLAIWGVLIYVCAYSIGAMWMLFQFWIGDSFLQAQPSPEPAMADINMGIATCLGSLLGCALLNIISFHRYVAVEKFFDLDHIYGFFLSPILAVIVGLLTFSIMHSGIFILSGSGNIQSDSFSASLGHLAIGAIAGYNWDVFIKKVQTLSNNLFKSENS